MMKKVHPPISYIPKIVSENGRQALAVIVPGSELRPHFAGLAYVRQGSVTNDGSEEQLRELIAQHNSKAATILEWKGKNVTVFVRSEDSEIPWANSTIVTDCNQFYVSVQEVPHVPSTSFPLSRLEINFDNLRRRLQLEISDRSRNAWKVEMERHVRQVLSHRMTREGQEILKWLLIRGRVEVTEKIVPEISRESQDKQMQIAVSAGILRSEQEPGGLHRTFYAVNPECWEALKLALPEILK
jgi:hypothetical protein